LGLPFWEYPSKPQDDPGIELTNGLGEVQNFPASHQSLHEHVSGVNSVVMPAANPLEDGQDGLLQASLDHSCANRSLNTA
jgi:hypothetical protein